MNIQSFARRLLVALTAGIALCAAPFALATTVTLHPTGFANGFEENFDFTGEPFPSVRTGGFTGTLDLSLTPITFFCFDLGHTFSFGNPYQYDDSIVSGGKYDELSQLFNEGFSTATSTADFSAGFQLAVWEILMESPPPPSSVSTGTFYVTNDHGNPGAVTQANLLLSGLSLYAPTYDIHLLHSLDTNPAHQDFVYGTFTLKQVPEPAPLLLIGTALAAMLFSLRLVGAKRRS
ncbi:MAG: hypothetical protein ACREYB_11925 [Casimicrobiaceae bacterium]